MCAIGAKHASVEHPCAGVYRLLHSRGAMYLSDRLCRAGPALTAGGRYQRAHMVSFVATRK